MTDLPCCRLCESEPISKHPDFRYKVFCSDPSCPCSETIFTRKQWRKLMFVPEKMQQYDGNIVWSEMFVDGYNAAIDAMSKGE